MKELSIFVDESGDFGAYEKHSPFYIFSLVFHDQAHTIEQQIKLLEEGLNNLKLSKEHCFHAGPIIRREEDYQFLSIKERRRCLNRIMTFAKNIDISYTVFSIEKKHLSSSLDLTVQLSKKLSNFIRENYGFFSEFDHIVLYYDNGQVELGKLLATVFSILLPQTEIRKVTPVNYRLFQVADLICTFELIYLKSEHHILSKSEENFFGSMRDMKKNYLKPMLKKKFTNIKI
ncbi:MAG: DUF3800 domain-containing protein [Clostridia bacterium]|nr:DUF3800 domain-containing protein [Clostridia bacterium]